MRDQKIIFKEVVAMLIVILVALLVLFIITDVLRRRLEDSRMVSY